MKDINYRSLSNMVRLFILTALVITLTLGTGQRARAFTSPAPVNLGAAASFAVLSKTGITTTGTTAITGNMGVSPIAASAITGFGLIIDSTNTFSTSSLVTGRIYAADYASPTPSYMNTSVSDMETAYTDAAGRTLPDATELYSGDLSGQTLAPGLYKWSTDVSILTGDVTLSGSSTDVWIFQISGDLLVATDRQVVLSGGAQADNVIWQVGGGTGATLEAGAHVEGTILAAKGIVLKAGASLAGRALAQTNVTLISNTIVIPTCVLSITRVNANPTASASVDFTVTFSEPVVGVDMTGPVFEDFILTTSSGISGASITGVTGSNATYTVTVNTGTGSGTIRLDVPDNATITNTTGQALCGLPYTYGETYTVRSVDVYIAGELKESYFPASGTSIKDGYVGVNNGPIMVSGPMDILSSIRVLYKGVSYSEMMGFPDSQLTNAYIFPYYNNVAMNSQLRVSNLGGVDTTINVYLGSDPTPIDTYTLAAGDVTRKIYAGANDGPMRVTSSATNILATIRVLYAGNSYSELLGYPVNQLTNDYLFPYYNNVAMNSPNIHDNIWLPVQHGGASVIKMKPPIFTFMYDIAPYVI